MSKGNIKFEGKKLTAGVDTNEDGENSAEMFLNLQEAIEEAFDKGEAKIDVKTVTVKFEDKKLSLVIDTDKDGEPLGGMNFYLGEVTEEILAAFIK